MPRPPSDRNTGRLFIALWPSEPVRAGLVAWQDSHAWPANARRTAAQDLHLTLHFIGSVPGERLAEIADGLSMNTPTLELDIDQAVMWPRGLAVLTPSRIPDALAQLHGDLAERLRRLQLPVDTRRYQPHVTLARRAGAALNRSTMPAPVHWSARGHVLAARDGEHYRVLRSYPGGD